MYEYIDANMIIDDIDHTDKIRIDLVGVPKQILMYNHKINKTNCKKQLQ